MENCDTCGMELTDELQAAQGWCIFCSDEDDSMSQHDDNYSDARDEDWEYSDDNWL